MFYRTFIYDKALGKPVVKISTNDASKVITEIVPYLQKKFMIIINSEE